MCGLRWSGCSLRSALKNPDISRFEGRTSKSICSFVGFVLSALPTVKNLTSGETPMARITLRQLLDHAAEQDYGVPAFNINNMEQALGDHDGGGQDGQPGHPAGFARRPLLCQRHHAQAHDGCRHRNLSAYPSVRASRPWQRARHLHDGHPVRLHLGDDGWFAEDRRQDAGRLGL